MPTCTPMTEKVQKKLLGCFGKNGAPAPASGATRLARLPDPVKIRRFHSALRPVSGLRNKYPDI